MEMKIDPIDLLQDLGDWRVLFHGTGQDVPGFGDEGLGRGREANSALGVHLAELPEHAAEYAQTAQDHGEGPGRVLIVLAPARSPFSIERFEEFFGYDEDGVPERNMGKEGFARLRQELLDKGHDIVDYEDGEGPICVALKPASVLVIGQMDIDEAYALGDRLMERENRFEASARIEELKSMAGARALSRRLSP